MACEILSLSTISSFDVFSLIDCLQTQRDKQYPCICWRSGTWVAPDRLPQQTQCLRGRWGPSRSSQSALGGAGGLAPKTLISTKVRPACCSDGCGGLVGGGRGVGGGGSRPSFCALMRASDVNLCTVSALPGKACTLGGSVYVHIV